MPDESAAAGIAHGYDPVGPVIQWTARENDGGADVNDRVTSVGDEESDGVVGDAQVREGGALVVLSSDEVNVAVSGVMHCVAM